MAYISVWAKLIRIKYNIRVLQFSLYSMLHVMESINNIRRVECDIKIKI